MSTAGTYEPGAIKRVRSTQAQVRERRVGLSQIIAAGRPMTVRQEFYQATVHGLVPKTEAGYGIVKVDLVLMRRAGVQ